MSSAWRFTALLLLSVAWVPLAAPGPARAGETAEHYEQIYLTHDQALKVALPGAEAIVPRAVTPTAAERKAAERQLGRHLEEPSYTFYEGRTRGQASGYAVILEEKGKYHPITFVVSLAPDGAVRDVAVMIYRERRGDAVKRRRFLNQFLGKTADDALMVNRDVVHLTGATVSSWALAAGVKKAVVLFDALGPRLKGAS